MANTFDWVENRAKDVEKTADFFENLFGWKVVRKETAKAYFIDPSGNRFGLWQEKGEA